MLKLLKLCPGGPRLRRTYEKAPFWLTIKAVQEDHKGGPLMKIPKPTVSMTILAASLNAIGVVSGANFSPEDYVYQYAGPPVRAGATGTCVRTSFWAPGVNDANCGGQVEARQPTPPVTQSVTT